MAGEQAVLFVDAALALFSPPGPYHGQQELRVGQLSGERGAGSGEEEEPQHGLHLSGGDSETSTRSELAQLPVWRARGRQSPFHMRR